MMCAKLPTLLFASGRQWSWFIDEFDRIEDWVTFGRKFADTIKTLSDYAVDATMILVAKTGYGRGTIAEHESISRAIVGSTASHGAAMKPKEITDRATARA